ncbi:hypothetical protein BD769DRAFT_1481930 [Suillus cothurnatus]|nr:hypothetical protein BD769DRAFT_1481930 [Suillus cothurnatus]
MKFLSLAVGISITESLLASRLFCFVPFESPSSIFTQVDAQTAAIEVTTYTSSNATNSYTNWESPRSSYQCTARVSRRNRSTLSEWPAISTGKKLGRSRGVPREFAL